MIYLHHIRRTGGRSLIHAVLGNFGDPVELYGECAIGPVVVRGGRPIYGWEARPPTNTFFAWSHAPAYLCDTLGPSDFTITIVRDPIERVLSHYRLLKYAIMLGADWGIPPGERHWAERDVELFLDRIPRDHLLRQIYMFSPSYNVGEARDQILGLSFWFNLRIFRASLVPLGNRLGLDLKFYHIEEGKGLTRGQVESQLAGSTWLRLQEMLVPEYELMDELECAR